MSDEAPLGPLTQESVDQARETFEALTTGESQSPETQKLIRYIVEFPRMVREIRSATNGVPPGQLQRWATANPPADGAFNHAVMCLNTAADALVAIYAEVVKAQMLSASTIFTLTRQGTEAALTARWLLGDLTVNGMIQRGFAADWADMLEESSFVANMVEAGAVEPSELGPLRARVSARKVRLEDRGRAHGLLKKVNSHWAPLLPLPSGRGLFKDVSGPDSFTDMRWVFNLLSGVAHGKAWATLASSRQEILSEYLNFLPDGQALPSGIVLTKSDPNAGAMILPLQLMMLQIIDAQARLHAAHTAPAPAL
jgi:hypothetical protein